MEKKVDISIIIVHYKVKKILLECIQSIIEQTKNISYEIIVVDNDEVKSLKADLYKEFPNVCYVFNDNKGFGQGNNVGVGYAEGKYLFFLNPDTKLINNSVLELANFLIHKKNAGIVAPLLVHENGELFELQGLGRLSPLSGIVALSFLNKLFPNNIISQKYWNPGWDKSKVKSVEAIPGTAFMISRSLYKEIGGFDENFFLYFEEFDLCNNVIDKGYKIFVIPKAKVMHLWGKSTDQRNDISKVFKESRFYYFKKHYGILNALIVELFARTTKQIALILGLLVINFCLISYQLAAQMTFIGDQGWFYLSARDLLLGKGIPLVGITSSHTWLHQGPLWTYLLAIALWLGNFNPVAGGYLSIIIQLITLITLYVTGKRMLGERVATIATVIYAFSPLVLFHTRMPYHTTPIPLFTLLYFFALFQWIKGKKKYFSITLLFLAILYNFELATVVLIAPLLIVSLYGLLEKQAFIKDLSVKDVGMGILLAVIPMMPVIIYDFTHGFKQTVIYAGWLVANAFHVIGISFYSFNHVVQSINIYQFTYDLLQKLVFIPSGLIALSLLIFSLGYALINLYKQYGLKKVNSGLLLCVLWFVLTTLFYFGNKTPSEAYLPMLFPVVFILIAYLLDTITRSKIIVSMIVGLIVISNFIFLLRNHYWTTNPQNISLKTREQAVNTILSQAKGRTYNLAGKGSGSQFASFIMPYEYLAWYAGHPPAKTKQDTLFILEEKGAKVEVTKNL